ncbi:glycosyltransferase [Kineococcus sp. SYSU DK006]|uniref:glycosyltransferase n=1 Tax=Kineococcus sp. SYSU DK006 TaxID=3383127 RepID=UPI003D7DD1E2
MTTLLVANVGGHLTQLHSLVPRLPIRDRIWVTTDAAQSRSLLAGEEVHYLEYPRARNVGHVLRNAVDGVRRLPHRDVERVISTGANLAVSVLPTYWARGVPCHYIESATRVDGPSSSGRLLGKLPGVRLYTQHETWSDERWTFEGTVLDGFTATRGEPREVRRVVVTLGSSEGYPFRRPLQRLLEVLPEGVEVLWQTGSTAAEDLGIDARRSIPAHELQAAMEEADVVIAHAGTGSTLTTLSSGKLPLLLPRLASHGEHVDDHQSEIAAMLQDRGLAVVRDAGSVTWEDVLETARHRVRSTSRTPFPLKS